MNSVRRVCLFVVVLAPFAAADLYRACGQGKETPNNAAAVRKALDQKINLDFSSQNFQEAIDHLRQKTKLNIVLDTFVVQNMGVGIPEVPTPVTLRSDGGKLRTALQNMLDRYQLTYVIVGDTVVITTEEFGYQRQMRQRVDVDAKEMPLAEVLKKLSDDTGANLVIDPRQADKAKTKITLQLDDVTLETAVRLLSEVADLSSVRVGNVLLITSEARADKIRKENQPLIPNHQYPPPGIYGPSFPGAPGFGPPGFGGPGIGRTSGIRPAVEPPPLAEKVLPPVPKETPKF
jgi:type II secretory pathway component GspD/PulD (secretin)